MPPFVLPPNVGVRSGKGKNAATNLSSMSKEKGGSMPATPPALEDDEDRSPQEIFATVLDEENNHNVLRSGEYFSPGSCYEARFS